MKQKLNNVASLLSLAALTLVFVIFFFPDLIPFLTMPILFTAFGVFILLSILTHDPKKKQRDKLVGLPVTLYFAGLIIVLQLLGGTTDTPLSINQPFLWIAIAIGIWLDLKRGRSKKMKAQKLG